MLFPSSSLVILSLVASATAAKHHLLTGTFGPSAIYALEFDDTANTLAVTKNITAQSRHLWISLNAYKNVLYAAGPGGWTSYAVKGPQNLTVSKFVPLSGNCSADLGTYILPTKLGAPYNVYGAPFGNCANTLGIDGDGAITGVTQSVAFQPTSGVHGMAFSADEKLIYSADLKANLIWTHRRDPTTGQLAAVGSVAGPSANAGPRHVAVHPNGKYLYVVAETSNLVAQYEIDATTQQPVFKNVTFPLLPQGSTQSQYWSDEIAVSADNSTLWATARSRGTSPGYLSALSLSSTGAIDKQLFLSPTTTGGGAANAVAPAPFSNQYVALTDSSKGFVQIWKYDRAAAEGAQLAVVAQADIADLSGGNGCCANAVWYD